MNVGQPGLLCTLWVFVCILVVQPSFIVIIPTIPIIPIVIMQRVLSIPHIPVFQCRSSGAQTRRVWRHHQMQAFTHNGVHPQDADIEFLKPKHDVEERFFDIDDLIAQVLPAIKMMDR